jgi:hypothetical protein
MEEPPERKRRSGGVKYQPTTKSTAIQKTKEKGLQFIAAGPCFYLRPLADALRTFSTNKN